MGFSSKDNQINGSNSVYFIGEVGINHNSDLELAKIILKQKKQVSLLKVSRNPESTPESMKSKLIKLLERYIS